MLARRASNQLLRRVATLATLSGIVLGAGAPAASAADLTRTLAHGRTSTQTSTAPTTMASQQRVADAQAAYEQARAEVTVLSERAAALRASAELAEAQAEQARTAVRDERGGSVMDVLADLVGVGESDLDRAAAAADNATHVRGLAAAADRALKDAIERTERSRLAWEKARSELAARERQWSARQAASAFIRRSSFQEDYAVDEDAQDGRNRAALRRWHDYLRSLADAGVVPPPVKSLRDPDRLPAGLEMLRDERGRVVAGVARTADGEPLTVLPSETVRAVSTAFNRVGLPEVPGAVAPSTYACGGLVANAWSATDTLAAEATAQWQELRGVPTSTLQTGDVVVLGRRKSGVERTGVYVGRGEVVVADPSTGTAAVRPVPRDGVYGVKRVGLPMTRSYDAPAAAGDCASEPVATAPSTTPTSGPFALPVPAGSYRISTTFGEAGSLWSSGQHTGLDFAAPVGTPVTAVAAGTVTVEKTSWAGDLVRIDHGGGVETWYAHMSEVDVATGAHVEKGQRVGAVGDEGNSTGPHLHLEVRLDGVSVDPALVLEVPELPRPSYPNGDVPATALCDATSDGAQTLRCDAAVSFRLLAAAYETGTGSALCITDSYRSREVQEVVYRTKPGLGAVPGTSLHGEGIAVDLCGGVERFDTAEHTWMTQHGPAFGWLHPAWAAAGGSRPEPWHFEYQA